MSGEQHRMVERAADLRRAFDRSFSEPPVGADDTESLLALETGGRAYAVRLAEVTGLFADRTLVRLPSPVSEFLGVAGLRHDVVPVFSLAGLLGHGLGGAPPRWLLMVRAPHPLALAFDQFDGYVRVAPGAVLSAKDGSGPAHVAATVRLAEGMRAVVSIASLLGTIDERIRHIRAPKEQ